MTPSRLVLDCRTNPAVLWIMEIRVADGNVELVQRILDGPTTTLLRMSGPVAAVRVQSEAERLVAHLERHSCLVWSVPQGAAKGAAS